MKAAKIIACAALCLAVCAISCKNNGKTAQGPDKHVAKYVKQRVEQMMKTEHIGLKERPLFYTDTLLGLYREIDCLKHIANDVYMDFQWSGKVFDVCSPDERSLSIEQIRMKSDTQAEADLFYEDPPCYEFRYTLLLEFKGDDWYINDVIWKSATPTRETEEARKYIAGQIKHFQELDGSGIDKLLEEVEIFVPTYDKGTIFSENPEEVGIYLDNISNLQKMLKKNPRYKASYDEWFSSYMERVRKEASEHGIEIQ